MNAHRSFVVLILVPLIFALCCVGGGQVIGPDEIMVVPLAVYESGEERIVLPTAGEDGVAAGTYFVAVVSLVGEEDRFELRAYAVVKEGVAAVDLPATSHLFPPSAQPMPEGFVTHEDASLGFAVSYSGDWEPLPPEAREEEDVLGYRLIAEDGSRRAMFKIGTWTLPAPQTTEDGYEESREAFSADPGYEFVERRDLLMGGFPPFATCSTNSTRCWRGWRWRTGCVSGPTRG